MAASASDDSKMSLPLVPSAEPVEVVVLGMPKCGTSSLHQSFLSAGLRSVHWALDAGKDLQKDKQLRLQGVGAETRLVGYLITKAVRHGLPPFHYLPEAARS